MTDSHARCPRSCSVLQGLERRVGCPLFDNGAVGMLVVDGTGAVVRANATVHAWLQRESLCGLTLEELTLLSAEAIADFVGDPRGSSCEVAWRRADGGRLQGLTAAMPLEGEDLSHRLLVIQDVTAWRDAEQRAYALAHQDPLTGLPNRGLLRQRLDQALRAAERDERVVGVIFCDLDRFKLINDSLGHSVGDALLRQVAERLGGIAGPAETVGRLGGDEFVLVSPELLPEDARAVLSERAEAILEAFRRPFFLEGRQLLVTPSLGISLSETRNGGADLLLRGADLAMYAAKEGGRNTYRFHSPGMHERALSRLSLESDLRHALLDRELLLYFQPLVAAASGRPTAVEALLRWRHPVHGLLGPGRFIELAEETGLIVPIGRWVLEQACATATDWLRQGLPPVRISVNVSGRQLRQSDLAETVAEVLNDTGLPPSLLELEITEGIFLHDAASAERQLRELKALGVSIALDDFGTGYSSLAYLHRFPIDRLKVPMEFVRQVPADAEGRAIITTILAMGKTLQMATVAEGVERPEQRDLLVKLGCQELQGYLFSPPVPAEAMRAMLAAGRRLDTRGRSL